MPEIIEAPATTPAQPKVSNAILNSVKIAMESSKAERQNQGKAAEPVIKDPITPEPTPKDPKEITPPVTDPKIPTTGDPQAGFKEAVKTDKEGSIAVLRKAREDAEARADAAERRAKDLEGKLPTDYDAIKSERELLIKEIEKRDITASPRFKDKYDKPIEQRLNQLTKTLGLTEIKPEDFTVVVQMPESKERTAKLSEMIEGLDRMSAGKVTTAISEYDSLREARQQEIGNPSEAWQQAQREAQEQSRQFTEKNKSTMQKTIAETREKIAWFKPIEGNEAWNKKIGDVEQRAWSFWEGGHSSEELSQLTLAGTMAPMFAEALGLAQQENERLNAELAELRGAKPGVRAGSSASSSASSNGEKVSMGEIFRRGATRGKQ